MKSSVLCDKCHRYCSTCTLCVIAHVCSAPPTSPALPCPHALSFPCPAQLLFSATAASHPMGYIPVPAGALSTVQPTGGPSLQVGSRDLVSSGSGQTWMRLTGHAEAEQRVSSHTWAAMHIVIQCTHAFPALMCPCNVFAPCAPCRQP